MDSLHETADPKETATTIAPSGIADRHRRCASVAPPPRSHRHRRDSGTPFFGSPLTGGGLALLAACLTGLGAAHLNTPTAAKGFVPFEGAAGLDGFRWADTCNIYVLRDGEAALLLDLGDGSVLDHLSEIGVTRIDWVLFTHHHREQCQGAPRLDAWRRNGTRVAAPEAERALFEEPMQFRKLQVSLDDAFTIHGSSFVRPPAQPIPLDRTFADGDTFVWKGRELRCVATPGNSPGAMTYVLSHQDRRLAFSGDVMLDGATMHTWYDTEWDYGFGAGIQALKQSVQTLDQLALDLLLPSHGPAVAQPRTQLEEYGRKLERLEQLYLRGYTVGEASIAHQDTVSTPTAIPDLVQVSPHLFKFRRPNFWPNFNLILADSGRALVVDCGLLDEAFLDATLTGMQEHYGLKAIDAVVVTHMHGDHFLEAPYLREKWGAQIWTLDKVVDKMEHPERFDYAAPVQAYGKRSPSGSPMNGVRVDRALQPGTSLNWEEFRFTVDWMPGQTEFALCLHGMIDGRLVAFTGDNLFGDPEDPAHTGHEAVVAHNSAILEEGYILAADYLHRLQPDRLVGGHSFVMDHPANLIDRYRSWAYAMRDAFSSLSSEEDYRIGFDPFRVRAEPYRVSANPGDSAPISLHLRNFRQTPQRHRIEIRTPPGWTAEPALLEGEIEGGTRRAFPFTLQVTPDAEPGLRLVTFDVTLDGVRYGERFDMIVAVDTPRAPDSPRTLHVSTTGDDSGNGAPTHPYRTIQAAGAVARPGDTILVHAGTYRERVAPVRGGTSEASRIVYRAAPGETVFIKGSERVQTWTREENGVWKAELPNRLFGAYNPYALNLSGGWLNYGQWHHRGDVYLNGEALLEQQTDKEVRETPSSWKARVEEATTVILANFGRADPNQELVEINVRECLFMPEVSGLQYITVEGFHFRHSAENWAPPNLELQMGAVGPRMGKHWIIQNCSIVHARCVGIILGHAPGVDTTDIDAFGDHIVRNNVIRRCGQAGIAGQKGATRSLIAGNWIEDTNYRREFGGWETAAIKFHNSVDTVIDGNLIRGVYHQEQGAFGIWIDYGNQGIRISRNIIYDTEEATVFLEMNHGPTVVDHNILIGHEIRSNSEATVFAHNLLVDCPYTFRPDLERRSQFYQPHTTRVAGRKAGTARDDKWFNNIFVRTGLDRVRRAEGYESDYNVFLEGAQKSTFGDPHSCVDAVATGLRLDSRPLAVTVTFSVPESLTRLSFPRVDAELVGLFSTVGQTIEDRHGRPLSLGTDLNGATFSRSLPGPLANLQPGHNTIERRLDALEPEDQDP